MLAAIVFFSSITIFLLAVDVAAKSFIEETMEVNEEKKLLADKITLCKVYNEGFALNFFQKYPSIVKITSLVMSVLITIYQICLFFRKGNTLIKLGTSLLVAGAWSNTLDRILRGKVIDYFSFNVKWKKLKELAFNLGDMFIVLGSILFLLGKLFKIKK